MFRLRVRWGFRTAGTCLTQLGMMLRMGSIGAYIFRTTFGAFLVVLVSLTAVIWVTQALHDIDDDLDGAIDFIFGRLARQAETH